MNITTHSPGTVDELINLVNKLKSREESFTFHAGGTDLVPYLKNQKSQFEHIIFLSALPKTCREVEKKREKIYIGAQMTLDDLSHNDLIRQHTPYIAKIAPLIASPQIRYKATIGGNILVDNRCVYYNQTSITRDAHGSCFKAEGNTCHLIKSAKRGDEILCRARFVSDLVPSLLIANARLSLLSPQGRREIPLRALYKKDGIERLQMQSDEFLQYIVIDISKPCIINYKKLRVRKAIDFPSLGVALELTPQELSVAITGLDTHPHYYTFQLSDFCDKEAMLNEAAKRCMQQSAPLKQDFFPPAYRKKMVSVYIKELADKEI